MNRRVLIDGYQTSDAHPVWEGQGGSDDRAAKRPPSGPGPDEPLPKTTSSIHIPPKK